MAQVLAAVLLAALAFLSAKVSAAELRITGKAQVGYGINDVLMLSGPIEVGDAERVRRVMSATRGGNSALSTVGRMTLSGSGGNFAEAVKIARLLREHYVQTVVLKHDRCADACAVAFMGGSGGPFEDTTVVNPARCLQPGGEVVFSLPSFSDGARVVDLQGGGETLRQARQEAFLFIVTLLQLARDHQWPTALVDRVLDEGIGPKTLVSKGNDELSLLKVAAEDGQSDWSGGIDFGDPCPIPLWN